MKNLIELQDALDRDLAWRKRELSSIKSSVAQAVESESHIFRSFHVLACSHWEGFLKNSLTYYLQHIFSQEILLKNLSPFVIAVSLFKDLKDAAKANYPGSEFHYLAFARTLIEKLEAFPSKPGWSVDTEGNPGEEVLARLLKSTGLDTKLGMSEAQWETTKKFINEQLLKDRNSIAHGQGVPIQRQDLLDRIDRLLNILDILSDQIYSGAATKKYMS